MRDSIILTPFRDEIELRIRAGQSQKKIMSWLASKGVIAGRTTYTKFCREEGLRRKTAVPATDPAIFNRNRASDSSSVRQNPVSKVSNDR
jgi:hypothetical protein